ncbi:MAG TPA: 4-alpha-glucanotransferase [Chthoniobacterales bacterium]|nr:4-alpha-glucanotransferase [Chthoniobacterales bacterium]
MITADIHALRDQFQIPGTRVLQFAFDGRSDNPHLPQNHRSNMVANTGTHDNPTSRGWSEELPPNERQNLRRYLNSPQRDSSEVVWDLRRLGWSSPAALAIAPLQDLLNLGAEARMNVPGRAEGNWSWPCTEELLSAADFHWLRDLTSDSNRLPVPSKAAMGMADPGDREQE